MTRLEDRVLDSPQFSRRKATEDTKRKITGWDVWHCDGPTYSHEYDRTTSLYVHDGQAIVTFANGESVDLVPGDFLTIEAGAKADWDIPVPIRNSYTYHDTLVSAANRESQIRWRKD